MAKYKVTLTEAERETLEKISQRGSHRSQKVKTALILLNCDRGPYSNKSTNEQIAKILKVGMRTIERVKKRFVEAGLTIALNGKEKGRVYERKADGDFEAHLVALSCSEPPVGRAKWSLRLLAEKMVALDYVDYVSHETIRQVLKKTN
jgi:transposase